MSRLKKALDGRDSHIWTLRLVIGILVIVVAYSLYGWKQSPERIKIDIPPDLRSGSTRGIEERHPFNVYAFGFYIFQQMACSGCRRLQRAYPRVELLLYPVI